MAKRNQRRLGRRSRSGWRSRGNHRGRSDRRNRPGRPCRRDIRFRRGRSGCAGRRGGANLGELHSRAIFSKRSLHIFGNLDLSLTLAAGEQRGIDLRQNLVQRNRHFHFVEVRLQRKHVGNQVPQFAKRNFHQTAAKLREHLFQRESDKKIRHPGLPDPRFQFQGQHRDDCMERNLDAVTIADGARGINRRRRRSRGRLAGGRALGGDGPLSRDWPLRGNWRANRCGRLDRRHRCRGRVAIPVRMGIRGTGSKQVFEKV